MPGPSLEVRFSCSPFSEACVSESESLLSELVLRIPTFGRSLKRFLADLVCSFSSKGSSMHWPRYGTIRSDPPGCYGRYSATSYTTPSKITHLRVWPSWPLLLQYESTSASLLNSLRVVLSACLLSLEGAVEVIFIFLLVFYISSIKLSLCSYLNIL